MSFIVNLKQKINEYFELIKFEHTIFALPFAMSGMLLAKLEGFPAVITFVWVILAMVGGRTAAMALNRVIDVNIDRLNPRTSNRAIPAGRIRALSGTILAMIGFALMIFAVWHLPLICKQLLPLAVLILVIYSYTKRFTNLSHLVLGGALGAAASGGWLAVSGEFTLPVVLWGLAIVFWVGGFDIIYALQDMDFDRKAKLFSIPASFGIKNSLLISRIFHIITIALLLLLGIIYPTGLFFWVGIVFIAGMLVYEHLLIKDNDLSKVNEAFFNANGLISTGFMLFVILDKIKI